LYRTGQQTCNLADYAGKAVVVRGSIIDGAATGDGAYVFELAAVEMLFPKRQAVSTKIKVIQFPDAHVRSAETVRLKPGFSGSFELRVRAPLGGRSAGKSACFAYCAQVWCQPTNINGCALAAQIRAGGWLDDLCTRVRGALVRMHENNIGKDLGDLLSSMVLGDKAVKLSDAVVTAFRNVGLSHVLAASGFNLTVVTAMTYFICRWLIRSQPLVNVICLINTICYVCLAGASASVMRAALMCAILLAVRSTNVRVHLMAALALSLFV
jgi:predicted membrane metal-binding protein